MIYIIPTKHGIGVEIWGTYDDLSSFYEVIGKFWNDENRQNDKGFKNRDLLLSSFSYEIRKARDGSRFKQDKSHISFEDQEYLGTKMSWVQVLFSLTAIKHNMKFYQTNKFDRAQILLIEFWLEKAMNSYDEAGAKNLVGYIEDGLYGANNYIYQYMRSINIAYVSLGGGKKAFRNLHILLRRGVFSTEEYKSYEKFLQTEASHLNCDISELEINDDNFDYESIQW